tara:strand:- start:137 stop:445 length:309 start_codon:yes stop_codon:yes gene_type:complete
MLPLLVSAGLSIGQQYMANRAAKKQQKRMDEEAAQAKLLQSFGANAQPTQGGMQGPGMAQQVMSDPLTQQLVTSLLTRGAGALNRPKVPQVNPELLNNVPGV